MVFGGGYNAAKSNVFYFKGANVEVVKFYTYLGITFKHNLLFDKHIQMVKEAASPTKAEFGVIVKLSDFKNDDINLALHLFDSLVAPVIEYGIEFWGEKGIEKIEKVNLHFYKCILGVKKSTTDNAVYGELGRRPCHFRKKWKQVAFWERVVNLPESRLVHKAYKLALLVALELDKCNNSVFMKNFKETLTDIEMVFFSRSATMSDIDVPPEEYFLLIMLSI